MNNIPYMLLAKRAVEYIVLKGFQTIVVQNPHFRWGSLNVEHQVCEECMGRCSIRCFYQLCFSTSHSLSEYILDIVIKAKRKSWSTLLPVQTSCASGYLDMWLKCRFQFITFAVGPEIHVSNKLPIDADLLVFWLHFHIERLSHLLSASQTLTCIWFTSRFMLFKAWSRGHQQAYHLGDY